MAKILSNKKSTGGSPYAYYSVEATSSNRSTSSVDITVKVTSNLQYSSSSLGSGSNFGLIGYIKLNNTEYSMTLKATNVTWSGTTKHTTTSTFNVNAPGSQQELTNVKFRVSRTGSYANDYSKGGALSSTTCNNISIGIGHTPPSNVDFYLEETSEKLINAGIPETTYVKSLSNKRVTMAYTLHDEATASRYGIQDKYNTYTFNTNPFVIDGNAIKDEIGNKITFKTFVIDNMNGVGYSSSIVYDYIDYNSINLIETATTAKRDGQMSGKVKLNIVGTFYNGTIGNVTQTKPIVKYFYYKVGDTPPATYDHTIPSENIVVNGNNFSVTDYQIGSTDETASNYFNPSYRYRVLIHVEDNFTEYNLNVRSITVGEATWTEYKDRVDFKNISIRGININDDNGKLVTIPTTLFESATGTQSAITLSASNTNYKSIEIIFKNNDNSYQSTGRLYNANGHTIYLISIGVNSSGKGWLKATEVTLNDNKITFSNNYSEITLANGSSVSIKHTNSNYITKVIGYDN